MKFLIISKPLAGAPPREDPVATLTAAKQYLNALLADGTLECLYITPDGGGVAIGDVESVEELWEKNSAYPLSQQLHSEFYPLLDHEHYYDTLIRKYQETAGK
jgi:hypothetical protein